MFNRSSLSKQKSIGFLVFLLFIVYLKSISVLLYNWNTRERDNDRNEDKSAETDNNCDSESFSYQRVFANKTITITRHGEQFDCSLLKYLQLYKLTKQHEINYIIPSNYPNDMVFVGAVNAKFFPAMKVVYYNVRKHFGDNNKLILYDLGGVKGQYKDDIAQMHNIELRQFDFTQFPEHVKDLHLFSWKILILAQVFNEATNIIYLDSSVYVLSSKYGPFFDQMTNFKLTPLLMIGRTHHSMGFATHPRMFDYLPLDFSVSKKSEMSEAGFLLLHRSESTRQLLKWATLCALTLDCINPPGSNITCDTTRINEIAVCNRQDQSVLNILLYNMGRQLKNKGYKTKSFGDPGYPRNINCLHEIRRRQGMVNNVKRRKC